MGKAAAAGRADAASDYEAERRRNIENNQRFLSELGLDKPLLSRSPSSSPRRSTRGGAPVALVRKTSNRLRGIEPDPVDFSVIDNDPDDNGAAAAVAEAEAAAASRRFKELDPFRELWVGWRQIPRTQVTHVVVKEMHTPFTLRSIGTTVYDMGHFYVGPNAHRYWSNRQALFFHPYTPGYRASKRHFGALHTMTIDEGPDGPIFTVKRENGPTWVGDCPTAQWTSACLYSSSPKTRVSGPLFFGFSDPIIQRMFELLPGYALPTDDEPDNKDEDEAVHNDDEASTASHAASTNDQTASPSTRPKRRRLVF